MATAAVSRIRARSAQSRAAVGGIRARYIPGSKSAIGRITARSIGNISLEINTDQFNVEPWTLIVLTADATPNADTYSWVQDPTDPVQVTLGDEVPPGYIFPVGNDAFKSFKAPARLTTSTIHLTCTATLSGFGPASQSCVITVKPYGGVWEKVGGVLVPREFIYG